MSFAVLVGAFFIVQAPVEGFLERLRKVEIPASPGLRERFQHLKKICHAYP